MDATSGRIVVSMTPPRSGLYSTRSIIPWLCSRVTELLIEAASTPMCRSAILRLR